MTVIISGDTGVGTLGIYLHGSDGTSIAIVPSNWRLIMRAWA